MIYIVINADIIQSRKHGFMMEEYRDQIQELNHFNQKNIIVPFSLLKGDELQGVLKLSTNVFPYIRKLKQLFYPYDLRIGIGIGTIYHEEQIKNITNSWELNGDAFFKARDALDTMKENKKKRDFTYYIAFNTGYERLDEQLNLSYSFIDDQLSKWKQELFEITFLEEKGLKHEEIAQEILLTSDYDLIKKERNNITKKIIRSNWYKIKQMEQLLDKLMKEVIS